MRALVFHFSSLVGLLIFLNQLWNAEEIERTIFMAFAAGLVTYTVLMIGSTVTQRILARVANAPENEPTQTKPHASEDNASSPA
ncbi:MAG: hypothetical protein ACE10K_06450 [Rhodothermales bacterium]